MYVYVQMYVQLYVHHGMYITTCTVHCCSTSSTCCFTLIHMPALTYLYLYYVCMCANVRTTVCTLRYVHYGMYMTTCTALYVYVQM